MNEPVSGDGQIVPGKADRSVAMESLIGYILLIGVVASILLLLAGTAWHWLDTDTLRFDYTIQSVNLWNFLVTSLRSLFTGALSPKTVVNLGISVLLLTPYTRVLASMIFFLIERNWKYSLFTFFVFSVLTYSLFLRSGDY
jgi:uncharacterized membrane protein